jgi:riboflavin synthase alpha subunit
MSYDPGNSGDGAKMESSEGAVMSYIADDGTVMMQVKDDGTLALSGIGLTVQPLENVFFLQILALGTSPILKQSL